MQLRKNIGTLGRITRFGIGLLLLWLAYTEHSFVLLFFAAFAFFESFLSWCAIYQIFGINTCRVRKK